VLSEVTRTQKNIKCDTHTCGNISRKDPLNIKQYAFIGESMYTPTPSDDYRHLLGTGSLLQVRMRSGNEAHLRPLSNTAQLS
jgi:hypothetical protein